MLIGTSENKEIDGLRSKPIQFTQNGKTKAAR